MELPMPKLFYTDKDIEDIVKKGATSLFIDYRNVVLTELAYEKAEKLGLQLIDKTAKIGPLTPLPLIYPKEVNACQQPVVDICLTTSPKIDCYRNILRFSPRTSEKELRDAIVETGRLAYQNGLMISNDGNISVLMGDGNVLITPSGVCKGRIKADDLLIIDLQGNLIKPASDPLLKPTSEQPMHLEVYHQRKDVGAVIHTHLVYANALAMTIGKVRMDVIPEAAIAFRDIPITDFAMPSTTQNAEAIRHLIIDHDVLLIRNHGSLTVGKNLDEALINLERLEHISKTLLFAELLGNINTLPPDILEAIARIHQSRR
jgi:L-fuculose-phosphate aldolase